MTLDLVHVAEQLPALIERLTEERDRTAHRRDTALDRLSACAAAPEAWRSRIEAAVTRWPLALPLAEDAAAGHRAPARPPAYGALAVDGSHIDVDRHAPARCYVLNLGWSAIFYGSGHPPVLDSRAELQPSTGALTAQDPDDASREDQIRGEVLSLLRGVRELECLAARAAELPPDLPCAALMDGNLGLWNVTQAPISAGLRDRLIAGEGGLLASLNTLRRLADGRPIALGAYTSAAGTSDVVHALRVATCPMETPVCTRCPGLAAPPRPCDSVGVPTDADLFLGLLQPGERSALFQARSRAFLRTDAAAATPWYEQEGHAVAFFYLRVEDEMARVELPIWAATPERVGLLHALLLDQCAKGPCYPVALQEAHEQAVISMTDRRSFAVLLEREVEGIGTAGGSAKSRSKRLRNI